MKLRIFVGILFALHVGLTFFHLDHTTMWDDEASVVWFGKNYNKYGAIIGYDGSNIFSYRNGQLIDNHLVYNNPPLDIYYAAFIMRYFNDSDYTLRLSFAFLGMVAMAFFLWCIHIITQKDKIWFAYSAAILLLSVNYLLIEPNTRYYSLNFLFSSLSLLATLKLVQQRDSGIGKKLAWLILQLVSLYFLFLSHYLAAVCWWIMCFYIMYHQKVVYLNLKHKFTWITAIFNFSLAGIFALYFMRNQALNRPDMINDDSFIKKYSKLIEWLFMDLHSINIIPLWTILLFVFLFIFKRKLISPEFKKMCAFSLVFLLVILILNPQSTSKSHSFDIRYLYVIFPILYLWIGYLLKLLHEKVNRGKVFAIIAALLFINTSLFSAIPSHGGPQLLLPAFIKERLYPYPTAYSEALKYINKNFEGRKKILTLPGFHNTVFLRYVPEKILITNTLNKETPLNARLIDSLGMPYLYIGHTKPDYVFQFGHTETLEDYPFKPEDFKFIDTIPIYAFGVDVTRPELYWHSFGPKALKDTATEALYIFHD